MNTPFFDAIAELAQLQARFFVPGHKGKAEALGPFGPVARYDLTEIYGADDLSNPSGPLAQSQINMSRAYGSGTTLYSACGASSCVQAMLTLFARPGEKIAMGRGCHVSAVRALALLDIHPLWIEPQDVAKTLRDHKVSAVYVTSPDYSGRIADIPALARICAKEKIPLLVDNAHGAHLRFLQPDRHPLTLGADASADSAHKTLPCLTPAALLHLRDASLAEQARQALNLYSSTSPSYPVLASLDLAAGMLLENPPDYRPVIRQVNSIIRQFSYMTEETDDPLKICLCPPKGGWTVDQVETALLGAKIYPEYTGQNSIVLMASLWNRQEEFEGLRKILSQFQQRSPLQLEKPMVFLPEVCCGVREAFFGKKERLPTEHAVGRIAAGIVAPCPPGVPIVMPGERISGPVAAVLRAGGIFAMDVLV